MHFILNVGNTHVLLGNQDGQLLRQFPTPELETDPLTEIAEDSTIFAGCVVPKLRELLTARFGDRIEFLAWQRLADRLDFTKVVPETMGADRLANAVMLTQGPLPAICVDFGTAIHAVAVNNQRQIVGGFILPGRQLMRNALAKGTAQLPSLDDAAGTTSVLGTSTPAAMAAGIDHGARGAVAHLVNTASAELGDTVRIVLAGGDAPWFAQQLPQAEVHGATFTLQGLAYAAEIGD